MCCHLANAITHETKHVEICEEKRLVTLTNRCEPLYKFVCLQDPSKVMIVISASEPESKSPTTVEGSHSSVSIRTNVSCTNSAPVGQCKVSGTSATFIVEPESNGSSRGFSETTGADDGRRVGSPSNNDRGDYEVPSSPSNSVAAQKKHCGTGCCTVS
jgi:hypothetical protein